MMGTLLALPVEGEVREVEAADCRVLYSFSRKRIMRVERMPSTNGICEID